SVMESIIAVLLVMLIYTAAGIFHGLRTSWPPIDWIVNNFYFITLMDIIVVVGTWFQYRARFREFSLRFELDANRAALEVSNKKLDEAKGRFFANISHELRTPLTLLISPLETLLHQFKWDDQTKMLLTTMQSNGMRLLKLINDLLDLVRLESGTIVIKPEPLNV